MFNREKDWLDFVDKYNEAGGVGQSFEVLTDIVNKWFVKYHGSFYDFCNKVRRHIVDYTIKQYGDAPDDQVQGWSVETCEAQVHKYLNRIGKNVRDGQDEMDLFKAAHFNQIIWTKKR